MVDCEWGIPHSGFGTWQLLEVHAKVDGELVEDDVPVVGLPAVEFGDEVGDSADGGVEEGVETAVLVGIEGLFVIVDVLADAAEADAGDGEFVGEVELIGVGEEVGVFVFADDGAVEAVFEGVGVAGWCADCAGVSAVSVAKLGVFHGRPLAGTAGGGGGGAGCHNGIVHGRGG